MNMLPEERIDRYILKHYINKFDRVLKGGRGSGHWGHKGVRGRRGGSAPTGKVRRIRPRYELLNADSRKKLEKFREVIKDKNPDDLNKLTYKIAQGHSKVGTAINGWYHESHSMHILQAQITKAFGLRPRNVRGKREKALENMAEIDSYAALELFKVYEATQEKYKFHDTVTVYRGVGGNTYNKIKHKDIGDKIDYKTDNLSCWTLEPNIARKFQQLYSNEAGADTRAGCIIKMEVPKENILMDYETGHSHYDREKEITVLGDRFMGEIYDMRDSPHEASRRDVRHGVKL